MAGLLVILAILGCVAYGFLKGSTLKSFAMLISAICASVVAFNFFELVASLLTRFEFLTAWLQALSFLLLFVIVFAIFAAIAIKLIPKELKLGNLSDRISSAAFSAFLGLALTGTLLTFLAMTPTPKTFPYSRFEDNISGQPNPNKVLLDADGFITGIFNMLSHGAFGGKNSFAVIHQNFLDQIYLNRHKANKGVAAICGAEAIVVPRKIAAWPGSDSIKSASTGEPIERKSKHNLMIVRSGINGNLIKDGGIIDEKGKASFTLSQLRLICKKKGEGADLLQGTSKVVYPEGYMKLEDQLRATKLSEEFSLKRDDFIKDPKYGKIRWLDLAFYVPENYEPALIQFKQNAIARVPSVVSADQAPPTEGFVPLSKCVSDIAELKTVKSAIYGVELASGKKLLSGFSFDIQNPIQWQNAESMDANMPAIFDNDTISCVKAELRVEIKDSSSSEKSGKSKKSKKSEPKELLAMLEPPEGFTLLSLMCNNPKTGEAITSDQFPVLVELSGKVHKPAGLIASKKDEEEKVYQFDYCSASKEVLMDGLEMAEDGTVTKAFSDSLWLAEKEGKIEQLYLLYLIKAENVTIIVSVDSSDGKTSTSFKDIEGFSVKADE